MIKSILWLIVLAVIVYILFDITVFVYRKWTGKSKEQAQKDIYNFFNSQNTYLIRNDMVFNDKMWNIVKSVIGDERFSRLKEIAEELWLRAYDETSGIPCLRYSMDIDEEEKNIIKERMKKRLQSTLELHNFPTKVMAEWHFNEEADMPCLYLYYAETEEQFKLLCRTIQQTLNESPRKGQKLTDEDL